MTRADRRRLHLAKLETERLPPAIRAALQLGAKIEGSRARRGAFLLGLWLGFVIGLVVAIALVRVGAYEAQR